MPIKQRHHLRHGPAARTAAVGFPLVSKDPREVIHRLVRFHLPLAQPLHLVHEGTPGGNQNAKLALDGLRIERRAVPNLHGTVTSTQGNPGARESLGKEFRKAVENPAAPIASHQGRTSGNKAIYKRL